MDYFWNCGVVGDITEGPCAYLVAGLCEGQCITSWHLDFPHVVRDLVRLKLCAEPGMHIEEVHVYFNIYI